MNDPREHSVARPPFSVLVLVFTAVLAHAALWCGHAVPSWVLPVAIGLAGAVRRPQWPRFDGWPVAALVILGAAAITYGSVATLDRSWDGFATWSLTARHLAAGASLDDPYFANPSVYQSARGYPLLQPILLQQFTLWFGERGGRVLFPVLWVLLLLAVREPLRLLGIAARTRTFAVAGLALVPLLLEPGHGSAESGFAELLLALALTHGAAAIVLRHTTLALCVGFCLPLIKNEGLVHASMLLAAATLWRGPRLGAAFTIGTCLSLAGWLPMQARLDFAPYPLTPSILLTAMAPAAAFGWSCAVRARGTRLVALFATLALPLLAIYLGPALPSSLGRIAQSATASSPAWSSLGSILATLSLNLVWVRKVGFSYVLLLTVAAVTWRTRELPGSRWRLAAPLLALQGAWLLFLLVFLFTLPADRLPLFQKEGAARYMIQMIGVLWLCTGLLLRAPPEQPANA